MFFGLHHLIVNIMTGSNSSAPGATFLCGSELDAGMPFGLEAIIDDFVAF